MRIAAVGDIHVTRDSGNFLRDLVSRAAAEADVVALCGDLTDYGLPEEARVLADEVAAARIPVVAVLGNHDYESGAPEAVAAILRQAGASVLDGTSVEIDGVGFAGTKGFGGGFGPHALGSWGEPQIKAFVQAAADEALKLETALSRLRMADRVVLLHYAPIQQTVEGEPPAIFGYLGSSHLEQPIDRHRPRVAVHGHAHSGTPFGRTRGGVPVYNVSLPLLRAAAPGALFRIVDLGRLEAAADR